MSTITYSTNRPCPPLPPIFKLTHTLTAPSFFALLPNPPPQKYYTMAAATIATTFFTVLATLLLTNPIPSNSSLLEPRVPNISAAPAFLTIEPIISSIPPKFAPDMIPFFPSPGGNAKAAPAGTLPIIPSNPSTPNPDKLHPNSAITPSGSAAVTSVESSLGYVGKVSMVLVCGLVLMWWLEIMNE